MTENRRGRLPDSARPSSRTKPMDTPSTMYRQKSAAVVSHKRKVVLSEQPPHLLNQGTNANTDDGDVKKTPSAKLNIPLALDMDQFTNTQSFSSPQHRVDGMLLAKEDGYTSETNNRQSFDAETEMMSPTKKWTPKDNAMTRALEKEHLATVESQLFKANTEVVALRQKLQDTKRDLKDAEDRLREKDVIIKDQEEHINELIESRVPKDDMDQVMTENERLKKELEENETLLTECQELLEKYVEAEEQQQ